MNTEHMSCVVNFHAIICDSHLSVRKPNQGALELSLIRYVVTSLDGWLPYEQNRKTDYG